MYGRAIPLRDFTVREFLDYVGFTRTERGCLEWNGPVNDVGYGMLTLTRQGHNHSRVHRVVWTLEHGPLPDDVEVRHTCDNPPCANLDHLLVGSHLDNMGDMVERRRHWRHDLTECNVGHDLTQPGATREYADGSKCVACRREREQRYARRNISPKPVLD